MDRDAFATAAAEIGVTLDSVQLDSFEQFEENLYRANEVMNLTRVPREECWLRHFLDSLLVAEFVPEGASVLDIGSGPGFPCWPLALTRPDLTVTALDSSGKMLGFLQQNLLPNLELVQARAEEWGVKERFDFVTGRAVAPLALQLELSAAPCKVQGLVVPMRTPSEGGSLRDLETLMKSPKERSYALGLELAETRERSLPGTDIVRLFPFFKKVRKTSAKLPRAWAEMKRKPLF